MDATTPHPLAPPNCRRCWRPLSQCVCAPSEADVAWLARDYPGLLDVKTRADAGGYADDRVSLRERRRAFLAWLVAHGKIGGDELCEENA